MEFRVKDLLITSIADTDPWCGLWTGPLCCCIGWTANGTTKDSKVAALTPSHLKALRAEVKSDASLVQHDRPEADDAALAALEAKLTEALDSVRSQRKAGKA